MLQFSNCTCVPEKTVDYLIMRLLHPLLVLYPPLRLGIPVHILICLHELRLLHS